MVRRANPDLVSVADDGLAGVREYDLTTRPITPADVATAFDHTSASLSTREVSAYDDWNARYGTASTGQQND